MPAKCFKKLRIAKIYDSEIVDLKKYDDICYKNHNLFHRTYLFQPASLLYL